MGVCFVSFTAFLHLWMRRLSSLILNKYAQALALKKAPVFLSHSFVTSMAFQCAHVQNTKKKKAHVNVFKYLKAPLAPLETHIGGRVLSIQARWKFRRQKRLMPTFSCVICYCILIRSHKAHRCKWNTVVWNFFEAHFQKDTKYAKMWLWVLAGR